MEQQVPPHAKRTAAHSGPGSAIKALVSALPRISKWTGRALQAPIQGQAAKHQEVGQVMIQPLPKGQAAILTSSPGKTSATWLGLSRLVLPLPLGRCHWLPETPGARERQPFCYVAWRGRVRIAFGRSWRGPWEQGVAECPQGCFAGSEIWPAGCRIRRWIFCPALLEKAIRPQRP